MASDGFLLGRSKYIFSYSLDNWYEAIKDYEKKNNLKYSITPTSHFIPLTTDDVKHFMDSPLTHETLITKIDKIIKKMNRKAFVKLSTRSPKDAINNKLNDKMKENLLEEFDKIEDKIDDNEYCVAFVNATRKSFIVTSGEEAVTLMAASSRIQEDCQRFLEFPEKLNLQIVIREWIENLKAEEEFRGFVYNNKLTAISQYCYYQYFKDLVKEKDRYEALLLKFFKSLPDNLFGKEHFVIDFAVDLENERVWIIEINPFFKDTSGCLFDWGKDKQILYGNEPYEFRVLTKRVDDPLGCLNSSWQDFIINYQLPFLPSPKLDETNSLRSRRVKKVINTATQENEKEKEVIDEEDARIIWIANKLFIALVTVIILSALGLYFYWGILLSYEFTIYLLSRNAWNFETGPFAGIRRPTPIIRPRIK